MKNILLALILINISLSIQAQDLDLGSTNQNTTTNQETIVPIQNFYTYSFTRYDNGNTEPITNVYFKDVNNRLDNFVGNWVYDDGTHYLKIIITKHIHQPGDGGFGNNIRNNYNDFIIFYMLYKENGIEKYNTIASQMQPIYGNTLKSKYVIEMIYTESTLTSSCKKGKYSLLELEYTPSGLGIPQPDPNATLTWSRTKNFSDVSFCPDGTLTDVSDFLIPNNITLHRE